MPSFFRPRMIFWMLAIVTGSMPVKGSSRRMILGLETSAAGDLQPPPLAAGKRKGDRLAQPLDVELVQQFVAAGLAGLAVHAQEFHHAQQVLLDRELAEDARFLGQVAHAAFAGAAIHGPAGDVDAVENDPALR